MSRILVADDNSNIQKMVALALKDEGIDVVAVGNGDAAMRKIPDLRPDLVLADIFMPVRNGYEVCEFVKSDSRYMNTPVVLLVGAFDPLDENETQRVRADGVLKKPFVPPDPLINMVKALLAKSNGQKSAHVTPASLPIPPPQPQMAPPPAPPAPPRAEPAPELPQRNTKTESAPEQQAPPLAARARTPEPEAAGTDETDEVVTASRDPNLGEPFWSTPEEPEEPEQPEEQAAGDPEEIVDMHSFGKGAHERGETARFKPDLSILEKAALDAPAKKEKTASKTDSKAGSNTRPSASPAAAPPVAADHYADGAIAETRPESEAASFEPASDEMPAEPFKFDPTLTFETSAEPEEEPPQELPAMAIPAVPFAPIEPAPAAAHDAAGGEPELPEFPASDAAALSWSSIADSVAEPHAAPQMPEDIHAEIEPAVMDLTLLPDQDTVITAAAEAARLAFSDLKPFGGSGPSADNHDREAAPGAHSAHSENYSADGPAGSPFSLPQAAAPAASPQIIEAVVNRVLERMQPQVMEVVNREVLRPAIEAMVRRELEKH